MKQSAHACASGIKACSALIAEIDAGSCGQTWSKNEVCSPTILVSRCMRCAVVLHGDVAVARGAVGAAEHYHLLVTHQKVAKGRRLRQRFFSGETIVMCSSEDFFRNRCGLWYASCT